MIKHNYVKHVPLKTDFISVAWYVGSVCNYRCSYCRTEYHDGKMKFPDNFEPFKRFIEKLRSNQPGRPILVTLYGGELSLWKQFPTYLDYCNDNDIGVRLITNGARNIEWWIENTPKIYSLIISYHHEFANEEHVTEIMKLTNSTGQVNMLIHPDTFDEQIEIAKRISENAKVFVVPKFLRVEMKSELYPYTPEQLDLFQHKVFGVEYVYKGKYKYSGFELHRDTGIIDKYSNSRQIFINQINRWNGWYCTGGIDSFYIDYRLNMFVGQCKRGLFGNMAEEYELPTKPFLCDKVECNCSQDIMDCIKEKKV
jgi:MoaA/NifB/PqqE/SkfB family radical SAM enzyme